MILILTGCAPDLASLHTWDDGDVLDTAAGEMPILVETTTAGEIHTTRVDARHPSTWVALDLDAGGTEPVDLEAGQWDVRFQRFQASVNGGISGDAGGEAVFVPGLALSAASSVPTSGWQTDGPDGPDEGSDPDWALYTWYDYDQSSHVLTPADGVWFVRADTGAVFALRFVSYYDSTGDSAVLTFDWKGPVPEEGGS